MQRLVFGALLRRLKTDVPEFNSEYFLDHLYTLQSNFSLNDEAGAQIARVAGMEELKATINLAQEIASESPRNPDED